MEIYSYELCNTANNLLQSARKLAKQFTDFATFKRNNIQNNQQNSTNNVLSQMPNLFNNALTNSTNAYSYSMHRFRLIAKAILTQDDVSESANTKSLQLMNDSGVAESQHQQHQLQSSTISLASSNSSLSNNVANISVQNKLPLFDYYSCLLRIIPNSSFI